MNYKSTERSINAAKWLTLYLGGGEVYYRYLGAGHRWRRAESVTELFNALVEIENEFADTVTANAPEVAIYFGDEDGDMCFRDGCTGHIELVWAPEDLYRTGETAWLGCSRCDWEMRR